jgi:hypothetical protein
MSALGAPLRLCGPEAQVTSGPHTRAQMATRTEPASRPDSARGIERARIEAGAVGLQG